MTRCNTVFTTLALAAAALTVSGPTIAQTTMPASGEPANMAGKSGSLNSADRHFVMEAAKGGKAEVALGDLAHQRGGSDKVRQFGARMVADHGKANDELKRLATTKGIMLADEPPQDAKARKLETLSGSAFDHAYMSQMLAGHKKTVALFEKESQSSSADPELKAFATKTLPTIQAHLQMLEDAKHANADGMSVTEHMKH